MDYEIQALIRANIAEINDRTKAVQVLFEKLGKQLRKKYPKDHDFSYLNNRICKAWASAFGDTDAEVDVELGHIIRRLYHADEAKCLKLVGKRIWERADDSLYFNATQRTKKEADIVHANTNKYIDCLIDEFGLKRADLSGLKKKIEIRGKTEEFNRILEGR